MAFTVTVTPFQLTDTETWTAAKFNQGFNPTITVEGTLSQLTDFNTVAAVSKAFTVFSTANDEITATGHGLTVPTSVDNVVRARVSNSGGALPGGLEASTTYDYYVRVVDANTLTLHTTAAGALANTNRVDITSNGTGTHTIAWTPRVVGEAVILNPTSGDYEIGVVGRQNLPEMIGATTTANGSRGAVPQPKAGDDSKALFGDGTWRDPQAGVRTGSDLYLYHNSI